MCSTGGYDSWVVTGGWNPTWASPGFEFVISTSARRLIVASRLPPNREV
jgi:hypothetical protein